MNWLLRWVPEVLIRRLAGFSPVTRAVALTALFAASLYAVADTIRTLHESTPVDALLLRVLGALALALALGGLTLRKRGLGGRDEIARYLQLINTLPFGIACWTDEARLVICNDRFRNRVGGAMPEPKGASYAEVVEALQGKGYMQLIREGEQNRLLELHREDGSTLLLEERPLGGSGFVTMVMDVTESRRTNTLLTSIRAEQRTLARQYHEEKLKAEAASRSKTSFLAHLSHDIRTPLNHIIGFADMIQQQPFGPLGDARYLGYVESVKHSGERLLGFFASILELAELEGGRRELKSQRFTADELLVGVLRKFSTQAQRAGLTLGLGGACDAVLAADRFAIERMVTNLVENAIRFTPRGGKVSLAAYSAADGVVLEITDTGMGIAPERLATLSQPFSFGDSALTRDREGAGLGIAISRAIAEASGGHLAIDSRQGLGTTVAVSLPLAAEQDAQAVAA